ncbi:ATP-dependent DNA helicase [Portibacter lacus]|uniref:AAA+ ATPase domain-containing protein n=1 Tax=Portibacter lacus TaxID=1099794 RepID=A0AA37WD34_9BACT|nr:DEAD/DEAH box helicase [Portibacter lacus]GLR15447.1 hypothetical protein GCM10007940_00620 [Portibacter lacus]
MIGGSPLTLSDEHRYALDRMEHSSEHLFITGRAGTGKSTLLQLFAKTTKKKLVVLAPTGIAALNVNGQTIHSFFGFPPKLLMKHDIGRRKNYRMFLNIDIIIIDEISMVRVDMMDNIDWFLRVNRGKNIPFGGVQMIFFGDLFQLPPVIGNKVEGQYLMENYESPYFFSAHVWQEETDFEMIELSNVYRQDERHFINILDNIRTNDIDEYTLMDLNERYVEEIEESEFVITLSSRNSIVNEINRRHISQLNNEEFTYLAKVTGNFPPTAFPAELALKLKIGSQVMFVKNDPEKQFVNGTIGKVVDLAHEEIHVEILNRDGSSATIKVPKLLWEIQKYKNKEEKISTEIIGTFEQFPLRLAWAITIHKSQGKTFDNVIIDVGTGSFEYGQTYVALSRCRSLEGIQLKRQIRPRDIFVDEKIVDFYQQKMR